MDQIGRDGISLELYVSGPPFNTVTVPPPPPSSGVFIYVFKAQMKEIINGIAAVLQMAISTKLATHPTT